MAKGFKLHAVKQVTELNKPATQVARDLDDYQTLCKRIQKYNENQEENFVGSGNLRSDGKAIRDIEKRLRDLEEEKTILKRAMGIFSKDLK